MFWKQEFFLIPFGMMYSAFGLAQEPIMRSEKLAQLENKAKPTCVQCCVACDPSASEFATLPTLCLEDSGDSNPHSVASGVVRKEREKEKIEGRTN